MLNHRANIGYLFAYKQNASLICDFEEGQKRTKFGETCFIRAEIPFAFLPSTRDYKISVTLRTFVLNLKRDPKKAFHALKERLERKVSE